MTPSWKIRNNGNVSRSLRLCSLQHGSATPASDLGSPESGRVLGLPAGHAPVIGLMNRPVVSPGSLVVDWKPLYGLRG